MASTTLAQRLNDLAAANDNGLLSDDEYRLLRQNLFERYSGAALTPSEVPLVLIAKPTARKSQASARKPATPRSSLSTTIASGASLSVHVKAASTSTPVSSPPTTPPVNILQVKPTASVSTVSNLFRKATGRKSSNGVGTGSLAPPSTGNTSGNKVAPATSYSSSTSIPNVGSVPDMTPKRSVLPKILSRKASKLASRSVGTSTTQGTTSSAERNGAAHQHHHHNLSSSSSPAAQNLRKPSLTHKDSYTSISPTSTTNTGVLSTSPASPSVLSGFRRPYTSTSDLASLSVLSPTSLSLSNSSIVEDPEAPSIAIKHILVAAESELDRLLEEFKILELSALQKVAEDRARRLPAPTPKDANVLIEGRDWRNHAPPKVDLTAVIKDGFMGGQAITNTTAMVASMAVGGEGCRKTVEGQALGKADKLFSSPASTTNNPAASSQNDNYQQDTDGGNFHDAVTPGNSIPNGIMKMKLVTKNSPTGSTSGSFHQKQKPRPLGSVYTPSPYHQCQSQRTRSPSTLSSATTTFIAISTGNGMEGLCSVPRPSLTVTSAPSLMPEVVTAPSSASASAGDDSSPNYIGELSSARTSISGCTSTSHSTPFSTPPHSTKSTLLPKTSSSGTATSSLTQTSLIVPGASPTPPLLSSSVPATMANNPSVADLYPSTGPAGMTTSNSVFGGTLTPSTAEYSSSHHPSSTSSFSLRRKGSISSVSSSGGSSMFSFSLGSAIKLSRSTGHLPLPFSLGVVKESEGDADIGDGSGLVCTCEGRSESVSTKKHRFLYPGGKEKREKLLGRSRSQSITQILPRSRTPSVRDHGGYPGTRTSLASDAIQFRPGVPPMLPPCPIHADGILVIPESIKVLFSGLGLNEEEGVGVWLDEEVTNVRKRREEVRRRYEERMEYLKVKVKGAELREKLTRK